MKSLENIEGNEDAVTGGFRNLELGKLQSRKDI